MDILFAHWKELTATFVLATSISMVATGYIMDNDKLTGYFIPLVSGSLFFLLGMKFGN